MWTLVIFFGAQGPQNYFDCLDEAYHAECYAAVAVNGAVDDAVVDVVS